MTRREESLVREALTILSSITMEMPRQLQDAYRRRATEKLNEAIEHGRKGE